MTRFRSIAHGVRRLRRLANELLGRDIRLPIQHVCRRQRLGSEYGGWWICPDRITPQSVVYSFGIGEDVSFALAMIEQFGVHVHGFDPTPKSIAWVRKQKLHSQFRFHEIGIADFDGTATFVQAHEVSFTMVDRPDDGRPEIPAPVRRLQTIADMSGHRRIDVLKMDIEGAESAVIEDLARADVGVEQILVEFHHRLGDRGTLEATGRAFRTLNRLGFKLFYRSATGRECSFIRV